MKKERKELSTKLLTVSMVVIAILIIMATLLLIKRLYGL